MRDDMNKLLCEHERGGSSMNYHIVRRARNLDRDAEMNEVGGREGMKYRHNRAKGHGTKQFGENLNPLYGWIRKQVSRPWDKAYSELCKTFDMRSTINQHILVHLYERIEVDTAWVNGQVCYLDTGRNYGKGELDYEARWKPIEEHWSARFYVDPRNGIVRENKKRKTWKQKREAQAAAAQVEKDKVFRKLDENTHLHLENGVWFVYEIRKLPAKVEAVTPPVVFDPIQRDSQRAWWRSLTEEEKREHGRVIMVRPPYKSVSKPKQNVDSRCDYSYGYPYHTGRRLESTLTHYYASKKEASAQLKRRLGLS